MQTVMYFKLMIGREGQGMWEWVGGAGWGWRKCKALSISPDGAGPHERKSGGEKTSKKQFVTLYILSLPLLWTANEWQGETTQGEKRRRGKKHQ